MTYAAGRRLLDADSHIMELPNFLSSHADPGLRDRLPPIDYRVSSVDEGEAWRLAEAGGHDRAYADELEALGGEGLIRGPKEEKALGAFDSGDRTRALDLLGFERQLVFSTLSGTVVFDHHLDPEIGIQEWHRSPSAQQGDSIVQYPAIRGLCRGIREGLRR